MSEITVDELLAAWREAENGNGSNGMTTREIAETCNISENMTRRLLKRGVKAGRIAPGYERRLNLLRPGWHYNALVYRVKS